jgi:hypothetical protein
MIILVAILILLSASLLMQGMRLLRRRTPYLWMIRAAATLLAWLLILLSRWRIPLGSATVIPLVTWEPDILFPISPALLVDDLSWIFALALGTLALAGILTDAGRERSAGAPEGTQEGWAASMTLTALAILAVMAGNLLTLLITWAAVDLAELLIWLGKTRRRSDSERVAIAFSTRVAGVLTVIAAGIYANASGSLSGFSASNPEIGLILLIAVGLRLGLLPPNAPLPNNLSPGGPELVLRLAPAAASLALLPRIQIADVTPALHNLTLLLAGLAIAHASLSWIDAPTPQQGLPFWIMGLAGLGLIAALKGQPGASLVWAVGVLLPGGLIVLYHSHHRRLAVLFLIAAISLTMLPFTPTWPGVRTYNTPPTGTNLILLSLQSLLWVGYVRHSLDLEPRLSAAEHWVWLIYPMGLVLILFTYLWIGWWGLRGAGAVFAKPPSWIESWPAFGCGAIAAVLLALRRRSRASSSRLLMKVQHIVSISWLYRSIWGGYHLLRRIFSWLDLLLEGQAGLLWALLLLVLLFSLITQIGLGG